jgi:hypothetical protein
MGAAKRRAAQGMDRPSRPDLASLNAAMISGLPPDEMADLVNSLTPEQAEALPHSWEFMARPNRASRSYSRLSAALSPSSICSFMLASSKVDVVVEIVTVVLDAFAIDTIV